MLSQRSRSLGVLPIAISLIVVAFLIVVALQIYGGGKGQETEILTKPIERANILQCRTQIRSITTAIEMYSVQKGCYPASLGDVDGLSEDLFYCPVNRTAYQYDPETGKVTCPDHP